MAIQNRRGAYADFDPTKMVAGEFAVVQTGDPNADDGKAVYMAFSSGSVKRLATYEDMQQSIADATEDIAQNIEDAVADDVAAAQQAAEQAQQAVETLTIDSTLTHAGQAADAKKTGDEIADLKEDLNIVPKIADPEETDADLYICDANGNVIAEFADGHIKTKSFDSSNVETDGDVFTAPTDSTSDVDIADINGNVLARFKGGNFYTKNFDSTLIRNLTDKKWVCLGDSLTEHNQRTTINYHDYIAQETGVNVYNLGHSGCGYAKIGGNGQNFVDQADNIPSDVSVITVFGSGNDGSAGLNIGDPTDSGTTTLCGYINATFDKIYEEHPTTPLGVITPTPWAGKEPSDSNSWMEDYSEAIIAICTLRGIPYLDLYHCSNLHPSDVNFRPLAYSKDDGNGVHPDETGHAIIAPRIRQFLFSLI